jgi:acetyltransferase-like isoleucine patch superfamily enzyme
VGCRVNSCGTVDSFGIQKVQSFSGCVYPHPGRHVLVGRHVNFHGFNDPLITRPAIKLRNSEIALNVLVSPNLVIACAKFSESTEATPSDQRTIHDCTYIDSYVDIGENTHTDS